MCQLGCSHSFSWPCICFSQFSFSMPRHHLPCQESSVAAPGRPPAAAQRIKLYLQQKKQNPLGMLQLVPRTREGKMCLNRR